MKLLLIFALVMGTITYNEDELLRPRPRGGPVRPVRKMKNAHNK